MLSEMITAAAESGATHGKIQTIFADNVVYPGTPDYLAYVKSGTAWETRLVQAKFEYDMWWQPGWQPKADALSFSRKLR